MEQAISEHKSPFATEPIGRLIAKFAIPCVISLLVNSLYTLNSGTLGIDKCVEIIEGLY